MSHYQSYHKLLLIIMNTNLLNLLHFPKSCPASTSLNSFIVPHQFTEHYITNANTVPKLILSFLHDAAGRQANRGFVAC